MELTNSQSAWLTTSQKITLQAARRAELLRWLPADGSESDTDEGRRATELTRSINSLGKQLIEQEAEVPLGATALLSTRRPRLTEALAVAVLTISRLDADILVDTIGDLTSMVCGKSVGMAVDTRSLFNASPAGPLHPFVHLTYRKTLDESEVRITEESLAVVSGLPVDVETAALTSAVAKMKTVR